jgi:non-heme chloroperoxidase
LARSVDRVRPDRRGHGRSTQIWDGNPTNTCADDLAVLMKRLDLHGAIMVDHSTGPGDVTGSLGLHGSKRVAKAADPRRGAAVGTVYF